MQKRVTSSRFITGPSDVFSQDLLYDDREYSPSGDIEVKEYPKSKYENCKPPKQKSEILTARNSSRRKRMERHSRINYEKSPVDPASHRYMVKHTYTKLEHDAAGPKFTVIK